MSSHVRSVLAPVKQTTLYQVMQKREAMKRDVKIIDLEDIVEDKPPSTVRNGNAFAYLLSCRH